MEQKGTTMRKLILALMVAGFTLGASAQNDSTQQPPKMENGRPTPPPGGFGKGRPGRPPRGFGGDSIPGPPPGGFGHGGPGGPGGAKESVGAASKTGYAQSKGTMTLAGKTYTSANADENAVQVTGGTLTLTNATISKTGGDTGNSDGSSFYGTNSAVYVSGEGTVANISGGTITTHAVGANAGFAYKGGTLNIADVTIHNTKDLSRGIHATGGGIINARNLTVLTEGDHASVVATDRGGGTVTVDGGTYTCTGVDCAVLYSTGTITASNITGASRQGEVCVIEGDNSVTINNSDITSDGKPWGMMILQSGSGDAEGYNGRISINDSKITVKNDTAVLCEVPTNITGTLTLKDADISVPSKVLMQVEYYRRWTTRGGTGNLVLATDSTRTYEGTVRKDQYGHVNVSVGKGVTWSLSEDTALDALVNDGAIVTNGHKLTYTSLEGNGSIK